MEQNKEMKLYSTIDSFRLLNIMVFVDNEKVYEGMVENAPEHIKKSKYTNVETGSQMKFYVYSEMNPDVEYK